jgi:hypothetical protein
MELAPAVPAHAPSHAPHIGGVAIRATAIHNPEPHLGHLFTMPQNDATIRRTILYGRPRSFIHHFSRMHGQMVNIHPSSAAAQMTLLMNAQQLIANRLF